MRRPAALIAAALIALAALIAAPEAADACSCLRLSDYGFLFEGEAKLPKNAKGIVWVGQAPTEEDFEVHRIEGQKATKVPFEVGHFGDDVFVIRPAEGMKPGQTFRFSTTRADRSVFGRGGDAKDEGKPTSVVTVTVTDEALELGADRVALKVEERKREQLLVAAGASCSARIDAQQVAIEVELPKAWEKFRDQLLFNTLVDGKPWRASSSLCAVVPSGRSWQGAGVDLLYTGCGGWGVQGLAAGKHSVQVQLILPGEGPKAVNTKAVTVDLPACEAPGPR